MPDTVRPIFQAALRGDDGVGPLVAETVAGWGLPGVRALAVQQLVPELAEMVAAASLVVFVEAGPGPEGGGVGLHCERSLTSSYRVSYLSKFRFTARPIPRRAVANRPPADKTTPLCP